VESSGLNIIYSLILKPEVLISAGGINELKTLNHETGSLEPVSYISKLVCLL